MRVIAAAISGVGTTTITTIIIATITTIIIATTTTTAARYMHGCPAGPICGGERGSISTKASLYAVEESICLRLSLLKECIHLID